METEIYNQLGVSPRVLAYGEELLKEVIREMPYKRPNEMASHIMKMAIMASQGTIKDDTTILVMGVWENKH